MNPNSTMLAAICPICAPECVRGLFANGTRSITWAARPSCCRFPEMDRIRGLGIQECFGEELDQCKGEDRRNAVPDWSRSEQRQPGRVINDFDRDFGRQRVLKD